MGAGRPDAPAARGSPNQGLLVLTLSATRTRLPAGLPAHPPGQQPLRSPTGPVRLGRLCAPGPLSTARVSRFPRLQSCVRHLSLCHALVPGFDLSSSCEPPAAAGSRGLPTLQRPSLLAAGALRSADEAGGVRGSGATRGSCPNPASSQFSPLLLPSSLEKTKEKRHLFRGSTSLCA